MTYLAIAFLLGVVLRIPLIYGDDGFNDGKVWTAIYVTSSLTWLVGTLMALHVLTGISLTFGR